MYNESKTCQSKIKTQSEDIKMKETSNTANSLAHTRWNCKYHIVFAPKYRRKVFYEEHRQEVREILRKLCEREECESDTRICGKPAKNGQGSRPVKYL